MCNVVLASYFRSWQPERNHSNIWSALRRERERSEVKVARATRNLHTAGQQCQAWEHNQDVATNRVTRLLKRLDDPARVTFLWRAPVLIWRRIEEDSRSIDKDDDDDDEVFRPSCSGDMKRDEGVLEIPIHVRQTMRKGKDLNLLSTAIVIEGFQVCVVCRCESDLLFVTHWIEPTLSAALCNRH